MTKDSHMAAANVSRDDVLRFRFRQHQLDRGEGAANGPVDVALLSFGVQDTGSDGAAWAMAIRGLPATEPDDVALAWTLRGAPHAYHRSELAGVAVATAPLSEADAAKRMFDAVKPLKAAGIPALEGLRVVAGHLREIATAPTPKGEASSKLTERLDEPYLRFCRPCGTTHVYEMPFRLAALQAGLELQAGTSPPVLRRVAGLEPPMYQRLGGEADARFDVIRSYLRFYGPARVKDAAVFLDAAVKDVRDGWPTDAVEVAVADEEAAPRAQPRFLLEEDLDAITAGPSAKPARTVRLVGPYDPYLQLRDRELLVADEARRKGLWPVLGRPGAIVADGELIGTWRPRASGRRLTLRIEPWTRISPVDRPLIEEQAERLASHRGATLVKLTEA
ncbi:MAG: FIG00816115: hypothetical protein [uncultured Acidimicrobiales bacterium]|uniref:Winged helix DNA-binding domain-containing protein n=1 Tax=uncultured Acidimicrobiales bacterium TaxID=310071 RepID=A0A6J4JEJ8_9ACTN|nr:MAG: FIG00816115: hypothetical protein [uncultured Acidimicrobiales bacterium]